MNFLKNNGVSGIEAMSVLASGKSLAGAGTSLSKRLLSKQFETLLLSAGDAYFAGYSSRTTAFLGATAISAAVGAAAWGGMKVWGFSTKDTKSSQEKEPAPAMPAMMAGFVALIAVVVAFVVVTTTRRQKLFTALAGRNMVKEYAKFSVFPLVLMFAALRISVSSDKLNNKNALLLASVLSAAFFTVAKKYYLVFKLNGIERDVFSTLAGVFEDCKLQGAAGCNHEHAGFLKVFGEIETHLQNGLKAVFGDIDYAEIARELSKAQFYDNLQPFTGLG